MGLQRKVVYLYSPEVRASWNGLNGSLDGQFASVSQSQCPTVVSNAGGAGTHSPSSCACCGLEVSRMLSPGWWQLSVRNLKLFYATCTINQKAAVKTFVLVFVFAQSWIPSVKQHLLTHPWKLWIHIRVSHVALSAQALGRLGAHWCGN